ncbi:uncharacterized protein LOC132746289 [Ruditapes philippinarum]|uniref:uncharacterized protein LOC132746289 n=1 Tax=Ruditapes philippinarum TaxID=129788 RepID=UPI00295B9FF4|nr:uncharacterized protein LOC132746289 [Ruditapes philippinarum]
MLSESALYPAAPVIAQPGSTLSPAPGSVPENGVSVRLLQDTPADAEFAGRLNVEGFRGKFAHNITERKLPIAVKHMTAQHRGQNPAFYNRTFVAELYGTPVGLLQLKFKGDKEIEKDDHISELGCWHGCRYCCFGSIMDEPVNDRLKCYLDHICVDEMARGKGVGKVLMQRAEYEARLRNCTSIYLWVLTTNRAISLYERQGYHETSSTSMCGCLGCLIGQPGKVKEMTKML